MKKIFSLTGISLVFLIMSIKFYFLIIEAYNMSLVLFSFFLLIIPFWIFSVIKIYLKIIKNDRKNKKVNYKELILSCALTLSGSLVVYIFSTYFDLNSVIVTALVSLFAGIFLKKFANEIVVGAFIGMGSFLTSSYAGIFIAVIIAFLINFLIEDVYEGLGGKLGATAFVGSLITFYILGETFNQGLGYSSFDGLYVIVIVLLAGTATYVLNNELKLGPIIAYSLVSLFGGIFLLFPLTKNLGFINIVFGASFVGMSSKEGVKNYLVVITASLLFGIFSIVGKSFINIGGRGGTLALISVLTANNFRYLLVKPVRRKR